MSFYDASVAYRQRRVPLLVLAGFDFGSGSSRDWAAKGPILLGVGAVIARSFERIHRSNLIGLGIVPLLFEGDQSVDALRLTGEETFTIDGLPDAIAKMARAPSCWLSDGMAAPSDFR